MGKPVHVSAQPRTVASLVDIISQNKLLHSQCVTKKGECVVNKDTLWHLRLGHAPLSSLKFVVNLDQVKSDEVCLTCPMSKSSKLPYSLRTTKEQHLFDIIHMDIWGLYRVPTHRGCRYFMTLVDEKNRATWTYLMQQKSQALHILKKFLNYVKNHFQQSIEVLHTDNALEFDSQPCQDFFQQISYYTSNYLCR